MLAIEIEQVNKFMLELLGGNKFDDFYVQHCEVVTFIKLELDGKRFDEWYEQEENEKNEGQVKWAECRPIIYEWIKGKKLPVRMKFDFCRYRKNGYIGSLRIEYTRESLVVYTGYMQKEFSMDRERQREWDEYCEKLLD